MTKSKFDFKPSERSRDISMLKNLLDGGQLDQETHYTFEDMLTQLTMDLGAGRTAQRELTLPQREWVTNKFEALCDDGGEALNLVSSGQVKRGKEVAPAPVLRNLPLKPPGRT